APIIRTACQSCHGDNGTAPNHFFSEKPSLLQNVLAYPGLVGDTPEASRLYAKRPHEGPAFTPDQPPVIRDSIVQYNPTKPAAGDDGPAPPSIKPFAPTMSGANTVHLSALDQKFAGMKLPRTANMVSTSIQLSALTVVAAPTMGVHITHPISVTWDALM